MSRAKFHLKMNVNDVVSRLKSRLSIKTDKQLAGLLNISEQNYANQKKKGTILIQIINLAIHYKMSMDWLIYGHEDLQAGDGGVYFKGGVASPGVDYGNPIEARVATLERQLAELKHQIKKSPPGGLESSGAGPGDTDEPGSAIPASDHPSGKTE
jgi:hypothetical protein